MKDEYLKKVRTILLVLLVLSVIPMLLVAIYSRPFVDDYGYSTRTHEALAATHSPIALGAAIAEEVADAYNSWQGTFSAIVLFSLQPGIFSEKVYGLATVILIFFFLLGNRLFFKEAFKGSRDVALIAFAAVCIVSMQTLPHAIQGFYWWNGSCYYTLFYSLMLIQWSMLMKKERMILPCILGFFIGGGNYVTALLNIEVTVFFLIYALARKFVLKEEDASGWWWKAIAITVFSTAGLIISAIAPGNSNRAAESASKPALTAIGDSFLDAYSFINEWMNVPVALCLLFLLPFIWHFAKKDSRSRERIPLFMLVVILFCLFASTFTPTQYSMSEVGPRRIQNIRYYTFILFMLFTEIEAVFLARDLFEGKELSALNPDSVKKYLTGYMLAIMAGILIFAGISVVPKENRNSLTSVASLRSVLIGEARRYAAARDEWTEILRSEDEVVTLDYINDHPVPIYYADFDITGNPDDYHDQSMCKYYGKKQIILNK